MYLCFSPLKSQQPWQGKSCIAACWGGSACPQAAGLCPTHFEDFVWQRQGYTACLCSEASNMMEEFLALTRELQEQGRLSQQRQPPPSPSFLNQGPQPPPPPSGVLSQPRPNQLSLTWPVEGLQPSGPTSQPKPKPPIMILQPPPPPPDEEDKGLQFASPPPPPPPPPAEGLQLVPPAASDGEEEEATEAVAAGAAAAQPSLPPQPPSQPQTQLTSQPQPQTQPSPPSKDPPPRKAPPPKRAKAPPQAVQWSAASAGSGSSVPPQAVQGSAMSAGSGSSAIAGGGKAPSQSLILACSAQPPPPAGPSPPAGPPPAGQPPPSGMPLPSNQPPPPGGPPPAGLVQQAAESAESAVSAKGKGQVWSWAEAAVSGQGKGKAGGTPSWWTYCGQQTASLASKGIELPTKGTGKGKPSAPLTLDSVTPTLIRTGPDESAESSASCAASDTPWRHGGRVRTATPDANALSTRLDESVEQGPRLPRPASQRVGAQQGSSSQSAPQNKREELLNKLEISKWAHPTKLMEIARDLDIEVPDGCVAQSLQEAIQLTLECQLLELESVESTEPTGSAAATVLKGQDKLDALLLLIAECKSLTEQFEMLAEHQLVVHTKLGRHMLHNTNLLQDKLSDMANLLG